MMKFTHIKNIAGASKLEFALVLALFTLFLYVSMDRYGYYQEWTESTKMRETLRNLQTGLQLRKLNYIVQGRGDDLTPLLEENPLNWLQSQPTALELALMRKDPQAFVRKYDAARSQAAPEALIGWQYLPGTHELVYQPRHNARLVRTMDGRNLPELRFRIQGVDDENQAAESGVPVADVRIDPVTEFQWM